MLRMLVLLSNLPSELRGKLAAIAREIRENTSGATMVEYSILIAIVSALTIALVIGVGHYVNGAWNLLCSHLQGQGGGIGCS